jgi:hypothetical protein
MGRAHLRGVFFKRRNGLQRALGRELWWVTSLNGIKCRVRGPLLWELLTTSKVKVKWQCTEQKTKKPNSSLFNSLFLLYEFVNLHGVEMQLLFSPSSMTCLGNAKNVVLSRCRLLVNMTNDVNLSYYRGNNKKVSNVSLKTYTTSLSNIDCMK